MRVIVALRPGGSPTTEYAASVQRRALGVLFCGLAAALLATAVAALVGAGNEARGWIIAVAAIALAAWLGSVGITALRR